MRPRADPRLWLALIVFLLSAAPASPQVVSQPTSPLVLVVSSATNIALTLRQTLNTLIRLTAGATATLPPATTVGQAAMVCAADASAVNVKPGGSDQLILTGTTLTAAHKATSSGASGDCLTVISEASGIWRALVVEGTWIDGGI